MNVSLKSTTLLVIFRCRQILYKIDITDIAKGGGIGEARGAIIPPLFFKFLKNTCTKILTIGNCKQMLHSDNNKLL